MATTFSAKWTASAATPSDAIEILNEGHPTATLNEAQELAAEYTAFCELYDSAGWRKYWIDCTGAYRAV